MVASAVRISNVGAWIEDIYRFASRCMEREVLRHPFVEELVQGSLPKEKVQEYFRQWYPFALEINTATGTLYHRFHWLTKRLPELEDLLTQKIADEFGEPGLGGHIRTLEATAAALGVSRRELTEAKLSPHARGHCDFKVRLVLEGTLAEYAMTGILEGVSALFTRPFHEALSRYYLPARQETYFATHIEADTQQHGQYLGHDQAARRLIELLVENDEFRFRPGFSPEYIFVTSYRLLGLLLDDVYRGVSFESLVP
jgi:pyrroloquinoline quinone (PQQ) biosynthesis protein C